MSEEFMQQGNKPAGVPVTPAPIGVKPKVAGRMGIGGLTNVYKLLNEGEIESYQVGRSRFITVASIERYIARKVAEAKAPKAAAPEAREAP
jgi:hypothetical protein